jgi:putative endonuclease
LARKGSGQRAERRALWHYRLRGYRILGANVWVAGYELDLIVRRGRRLIFVEVKSKTDGRFGRSEGMVNAHKQQRLIRAADAWLARNHDCRSLDISVEVIAVDGNELRRIPLGDPA